MDKPPGANCRYSARQGPSDLPYYRIDGITKGDQRACTLSHPFIVHALVFGTSLQQSFRDYILQYTNSGLTD